MIGRIILCMLSFLAITSSEGQYVIDEVSSNLYYQVTVYLDRDSDHLEYMGNCRIVLYELFSKHGKLDFDDSQYL